MRSAPVEAIDAVILWVDGADPVHRAKLEHHLARLGHRPQAARATRFASVGEVDFCVRSILKFAPFIRRIHVVTDQQVPHIFEAAKAWPAALRDKLVLVDHRDIFVGHEHCLPVFNSRSIETLVYRIPGLAEHFVYFNDDFLLIAPVTPEAFFRHGQPVIHGRRERMPELTWTRRLRAAWRRVFKPRPGALRASNTQAQALGARMAGFTDHVILAGHNPYPLRRATIERYFAAHPGALSGNVSYRLRDAAQFVTTALAHHLELAAGQAVVEPDDRCLYLKPVGASRTAARIAAARADPRIVFACVQSLDEADDAERTCVLDWLEQTTRLDLSPAPISKA